MQETERTIKTVIARSGDGHACNRGEVCSLREISPTTGL